MGMFATDREEINSKNCSTCKYEGHKSYWWPCNKCSPLAYSRKWAPKTKAK